MKHIEQERFKSIEDLVVEMNRIIDHVNKLEKRVNVLEIGPNLEWIEYYKDAPGPSIKKKY